MFVRSTPGANPAKLFFIIKEFFHFYEDKLGCFIANAFFPICDKHTSLTAKIGIQRKKKFVKLVKKLETFQVFLIFRFR